MTWQSKDKPPDECLTSKKGSIFPAPKFPCLADATRALAHSTSVMSSTNPSIDASSSLVQRCSDFLAEHRRAVLIGSAAVVVGAGAAYYASTSASRGGKPPKDGKGKKEKGGKPKRKTVKDPDGPLLEERTPKVEEEDGELYALTKRSGVI